jgi:general secretion pathway protein N
VKRGVWIALLALLAFALVLIARLPAAWVLPAKGGFTCVSVEGTLWSGGCGSLSVGREPVGDLSWELHPLALLTGKLAAHLTLVRQSANAVADVELGLGGHLTARNVRADLPLEPTLLPGLPPNLRGQAHVDLALARVQGNTLKELKGTLEAHDLQDVAGNRTVLGNYAVTFPGGEPPVGQFKDLGGPLAVEGTIRLSPQGYEVQGLVAPRQGAAPELLDNLRFLGSPDQSGRRAFSLSGTF